jgi:ribose transport system permease protein
MNSASNNSSTAGWIGRKEKSGVWRQFSGSCSRAKIWVAVMVLMAIFTASNEHFLAPYNLSNILVQSSTIGFLAIGMTFIIITRNIDLSVGSLLGLTAVVSVGAQGIGMGLAVGVAILVGTMLGMLNGIIIVSSGVSSFVVTLAAMLGFKGVSFLFTNEQSLTASDPAFTQVALTTIAGFPIIGLGFLLLAGLGEWILRDTIHGRESLAIGGNPAAAREAGIRVKRNIVLNYTCMGFLSALAGVTLAMQMGSATPVLGDKDELWAIAAAVLGGASLRGGTGSVTGTLGGTLVIAVLLDGLSLLNVAPFYVYVVLGTVLIGALLIDKQKR